MSDVTRLLDSAASGDREAAAAVLPLVYAELRKLAAARMATEQPGQTLEPTALVHEAYLRLVGAVPGRVWEGRGHFFAAAAEAMRRILVDLARRKKAEKHGGGHKRVDFARLEQIADADPDAFLDLDAAMTILAAEDADAAAVAKLRLYVGLSVEEAAQALSKSRADAYRQWAYARAWLHARLSESPSIP